MVFGVSHRNEFSLHFVFVTNSKWSILFTAVPVCSNDFDLTLMACLLRNFGNFPHPRLGFDTLPPSGDTRPSDDIVRIKYCRNQLVHSENGRLSPIDFKSLWCVTNKVKHMSCPMFCFCNDENVLVIILVCPCTHLYENQPFLVLS